MPDRIAAIADSLYGARQAVEAIAPPSESHCLACLATAYSVQAYNSKRRAAEGDEPIGRKVGLTSAAAQKQFGVDQPDIGVLWAANRFASGAVVPTGSMMLPRVEAELAVILAHDIDVADLSHEVLIASVRGVVPAIEIVDSRVADWRVTLVDTVADNASGWGVVVGGPERPLADVDLPKAAMQLLRNGEQVSAGDGTAVMGDPLLALAWAAKQAAALGVPLRAGELILTGAMGPVVPVAPGDRFEARIGNFDPVILHFAG